MTAYPKMTAEEWKAEYAEVTREYEELKARGLNLKHGPGASPVSAAGPGQRYFQPDAEAGRLRVRRRRRA